MNRTEKIEFESRTGEATAGVLALPEAPEKATAVVLIHEYWGVNDQIRSMATRLADAGFVAVIPDLFDGKVAKNADEASGMMNSLDWPRALAQLGGAVDAIRSHPRSNGKVAVMGFCLGGALTFATACTVKDLAAAIPFYGVPKEADYSKVSAPILAHFAQKDQWAEPERAKAIKEKVEANGGKMELCVYDAEHAFCNDQRPEVYSPENAKLAWDRSVEFIRKNAG